MGVRATRVLLALFVTLCLAGGSEGRKWRLPSRLGRWRWEGVNQTAFDTLYLEARTLYHELVQVKPDVEVTGGIWHWIEQAAHYHTQVQQLKKGQRMCEVGFGAGLSTLGYLRANPDITLLTFDLWTDTQARQSATDEYLQQRKEISYKYLKKHFGDRWTLVKGDSKDEIPKYIAEHPGLECDLIHIDGEHTRKGLFIDLVYFQRLATLEHSVLIDDLQYDDLQRGVRDYAQGIRRYECFSTPKPNLHFEVKAARVGKTRTRNALHHWCRLEYNLDFVPGDTPGWAELFSTLTSGRQLPAMFAQGNRHKGEYKGEAVVHEAAAGSSDAAVSSAHFPSLKGLNAYQVEDTLDNGTLGRLLLAFGLVAAIVMRKCFAKKTIPTKTTPGSPPSYE